jgi:hypothetical protein
MKIISRRAHGILDYVVGIILILAPRILGFDNGGAEARVPMILGFAAIIYSLVTRYELGLFKLLPFRLHLMLDVASGILLALSPWLFGFSDRVWVPHVVLGLFEIAAVAMTRTAASDTNPATGTHAHP